jgi:hypothetical protein
MNIPMEKFIKFPVLNSQTGTLKLIDAAATFTRTVFVNSLVWDGTTGSAAGGQFYIVTAVDSNTQLSLAAVGVTAQQGGGVPNTTGYYIFNPEYTPVAYGQADGTATKELIDSSENFRTSGVKVGDKVWDITGGASTTVTGFKTTTNPWDTLTVADDIFVGGDVFTIARTGADSYGKILRSADVSTIFMPTAFTTESVVRIKYDSVNTGTHVDRANIRYFYSDTGATYDGMREAIHNAVVASLQTDWTEPVYTFPGLLNPYDGATNSSWLGGRDFFFFLIN